ncbi:hypothetical protein RFI_24928 [Reticulomyxa filosa]|uniref:Sfi1 spindle body domain-containing protein n=1 Tax=Reticulomyxa filosa TaxID=46433 RepID=X6MGB9_RETFI|nr:hypothetical protein RFI_24928 [Reticulomyxa filosa]|eukprot:ETO12447.1 hypothetical protein RFI_24928 [Reticulomyxa filosa]
MCRTKHCWLKWKAAATRHKMLVLLEERYHKRREQQLVQMHLETWKYEYHLSHASKIVSQRQVRDNVVRCFRHWRNVTCEQQLERKATQFFLQKTVPNAIQFWKWQVIERQKNNERAQQHCRLQLRVKKLRDAVQYWRNGTQYRKNELILTRKIEIRHELNLLQDYWMYWRFEFTVARIGSENNQRHNERTQRIFMEHWKILMLRSKKIQTEVTKVNSIEILLQSICRCCVAGFFLLWKKAAATRKQHKEQIQNVVLTGIEVALNQSALLCKLLPPWSNNFFLILQFEKTKKI